MSYDFELDELILAALRYLRPPSQGSEYPAMVMPVLTQQCLLLQRNLLYTAITRGEKSGAVSSGRGRPFPSPVRNDTPRRRYAPRGETERGKDGPGSQVPESQAKDRKDRFRSQVSRFRKKTKNIRSNKFLPH